MKINIEVLEERLGYEFLDKTLLEQAVSHSSYVNERGLSNILSNERLEFLGDAVLELVVSENLFKTYPDMKEGDLTKLRAKLVCEPSLAAFAEGIDLKSFLKLGHGEEKSGGRDRKSIISDCLEAIIGAIYLDGGIDEAADFIKRHILYDVENVSYFKDNKTALQEVLQARGKIPKYVLVNECGPSHLKTFQVEVFVEEISMGTGSAHTKKEAEQIAAGVALKSIEERT